METKVTKTWEVKGSDGKIYEITIGFLLESKTIYFIDCTCKDFEIRRIKKIGELADIKYPAEPCKHIKPYLRYYESQGFKLKVLQEMVGPNTCPAKLRRELLERANYECEAEGCNSTYMLQMHRKVRRTNGGKYNLKNCVVLCHECHDMRK